jgi:sugar phosphate isomerase/epimerase
VKCYITSQCSTAVRIADAVEELRSLGYSRIELTGGTEWHPGLDKDIDEIFSMTGIELMVHNYFPPQQQEFVLNLAVANPARRKMMFEFIRKMAGLARRAGVTVLGIHPGFREDVGVVLENGYFSGAAGDGTSEGAFWDSVNELDAIAEEEGIKICIENLAPRNAQDKFSFVCAIDEIRALLDRVSRSRSLGMLVDLGHLNVAGHMLGFDRGEVFEDLLRHSNRIFQFHLSHNDGSRDAHLPNPEGCWQLAFVRENGRHFRSIPVVLEWARSATPGVRERFQHVSSELESL